MRSTGPVSAAITGAGRVLCDLLEHHARGGACGAVVEAGLVEQDQRRPALGEDRRQRLQAERPLLDVAVDEHRQALQLEGVEHRAADVHDLHVEGGGEPLEGVQGRHARLGGHDERRDGEVGVERVGEGPRQGCLRGLDGGDGVVVGGHGRGSWSVCGGWDAFEWGMLGGQAAGRWMSGFSAQPVACVLALWSSVCAVPPKFIRS